MQELVLKQEQLIEELELLAKQEGKSASDILADAVREHLTVLRQRRIWAETDAWYRRPAEARARYADTYVAVIDGEVVDHDRDRLILYQRVRERYGRQPVLIIEGGDQPQPTYMVSGARHNG